MAKNIAESLRPRITQALEEAGFSLWDIRFEKQAQEFILEVEVDREEGVDMDACQQASDLVNAIVDEVDPIEDAYAVEVASAGLSRDLKKTAHFLWAMEHAYPVELKLFRPVEGLKQLTGILTAVDDNTVTAGNLQIERKNLSKASVTLG